MYIHWSLFRDAVAQRTKLSKIGGSGRTMHYKWTAMKRVNLQVGCIHMYVRRGAAIGF